MEQDSSEHFEVMQKYIGWASITLSIVEKNVVCIDSTQSLRYNDTHRLRFRLSFHCVIFKVKTLIACFLSSGIGSQHVVVAKLIDSQPFQK